ncbi:MAG: vanomycin resistance protein VanB [Lachnospiraceae bacterium]|nr:vanomycin resistance protein VanB [Lachnospiraceae bacterium]MCI9283940.1 vanomycin resistance protein VanB [Lachnospiraceae bacterium]
MKRSNKWEIFFAAAVAAVFFAGPVYAKEKTLPEGLFVGEAALGGMTEEEAREAIKAEEKRLASRKITLNIDGNAASTTAEELGLSWENPEAADEAMKQASGGNLVERYMIRKDIEKSPVHVVMETAMDEGKVDAFIRRQMEGLMEEPQNASIARVNGAFQITPGVSGKVVDITATRAALEEAFRNADGEEVSAEAVVAERDPDIREEDLASIHDVLGTFTTDFSSSGSSRSGNLANGAAKINGHVLMPGETLSGYECMHPFTKANGYFTAAAYEGGRVVDSIGGGVCQIATTLYNAALRAELEITQRQNHSMIVAYVKPSMDAAIAGTVKDIKITNNYSTPIYVEGYTENRKLTFTIYGKETRPANRSVEYVSETLSSFSAGEPMEQVDPSMAPGSRRQVQSAHRGVKSRLWKVVTVDGVETERTLLHTDTYNASKAIVLVGPPVAAPAPAAPVQPEQTLIPPEQPVEPETTAPAKIEGIGGGPGVSAPTETLPQPASSSSSEGNANTSGTSENTTQSTQASPENVSQPEPSVPVDIPAPPENTAPVEAPAPAEAMPAPEGEAA